jgi:acetoin utilization protein AcuB
MKTNSIRHLPVVAAQGQLLGFLTLADLKQGLIPSMVAGVNLEDLMIRSPICVKPDDDIEIAAQVIYKHKISGLPVILNDAVVGILTETDIFRAFIELMGILSATSRIDVAITTGQEGLKQAIQVVNDEGGEIINVGMSPQQNDPRVYYFRLASCNTASMKKALEREGFSVVGMSG